MLENPSPAVENPTSALSRSGSSFGPSSLAPTEIHHLLLSNSLIPLHGHGHGPERTRTDPTEFRRKKVRVRVRVVELSYYSARGGGFL